MIQSAPPNRTGWENFPHRVDIGVRGFGRAGAEAFEQAGHAQARLLPMPGSHLRSLSRSSAGRRISNFSSPNGSMPLLSPRRDPRPRSRSRKPAFGAARGPAGAHRRQHGHELLYFGGNGFVGGDGVFICLPWRWPGTIPSLCAQAMERAKNFRRARNQGNFYHEASPRKLPAHTRMWTRRLPRLKQQDWPGGSRVYGRRSVSRADRKAYPRGRHSKG